MSALAIAACALMAVLLACGVGCVRGGAGDRIVSLMFAGEVATLVFLTLAAAYRRDFYVDCALAAAILPYPSSIVFAHFVERWL